jgi:CheY-like chemotaxis protein
MDDRSTNTPPVILVVDDEALLRLRAADLLEDAGYHVVEAADAAAALEILEDRPDVRLLFTDIQMPGDLDGMQLAAKVHERWPEVLLIVTSGRLHLADQEIPDHGRFVGKPYQDHVLLRQVGSLIADQDAKPSIGRDDVSGGAAPGA